MKMKKYLPYILVGVVITVLSFGPINLKKVDADPQVINVPTEGQLNNANITNPTQAQLNAAGLNTPAQGAAAAATAAASGGVNAAGNNLPKCSIWDIDFTACAAVASYYILFWPTSQILWFGGQLFNGAVSFALNGNVLKSDMVSLGWGICRDVANLFFIFILLYIAIATILQLSSYGMKTLLARLIIIALLVNFSLVITRVIIDASNVLAYEFYNKMTVEGGGATKAIFGENARDISSVFMAGFDPQQLFSSQSFDQWTKNTSGSSLAMLMLFLIASLMNLLATFVLVAGGLLFIIRVAVLWLLMILAPLAFLFMILPKTKGYADQWWEKLFGQAFFAPAFLFLFYLVAMMINKGFLQSLFESAGRNTSGLTGFQAFFASIIIILLNFTVLAVLMIACLIVAQKLGAVGASTAMSWGKGAAKWGQGVAGRYSKRGAGWAAGKALDEQSWINKKTGGRVAAFAGAPVIGRGFAKVAGMKKEVEDKQRKEYEKQYGSYTDAGLAALARDKTIISGPKKQAIRNVMDKRRTEAAKKENIEEEKKKYEKIERELPQMREWNKGDKTRNTELEVELKANELQMAQNPTDEGLKKQRIQILIQKEQVVERIKEVEKMETEKQKIEENRARRREFESLEERLGKVEATAGEKKGKPAAEKPKETT